MSRPILRVLLAAACLAFAAAPAASAQSPTLTGELFHVGGIEPVTDPAIHVTSYHCDPLPGGAGHLTMTAEGVATGPYPGTFRETLTVSWGDRWEGVDQGPVESVQASFRIDALDGSVVTGTKTFNENSPVPGPAPQWAACGEMPDEDSYNAFFHAALRYDATIQTADGTFHDEGDSVAYGSFFRSSELTWWQSEFRETFVSNPAPDAPATREDCQDDGWQTYGSFKNRGDCVAFVATQGRNPGDGLG